MTIRPTARSTASASIWAGSPPSVAVDRIQPCPSCLAPALVSAAWPAQSRPTTANAAPGLRAKPWYDVHALKVYAKFGGGLRLATTLNQAGVFKVSRTKEGDADGPPSWQPLAKGVADRHRQADLRQRAHERLAESLATVAGHDAVGQMALLSAHAADATRCAAAA